MPWLLALLAFFVGFAIGAAGEDKATTATSTSSPAVSAPEVSAPTQAATTPPAATPPAAPAPPPPGPRTTFGEGQYLVGEDIAPGRYKTAGPDKSASFPSCYWARLRNDSGEFSAIIANGNTEGPGSVTVRTGEYLEARGPCDWSLAP